MNVSRKMFDRFIEEATTAEDQSTVEKILFDGFEAAHVKLAKLKKEKSPTLLQRWEKSRTNRNDLVHLMWEFEMSNIPGQLDALVSTPPGKPTVSTMNSKRPQSVAY